MQRCVVVLNLAGYYNASERAEGAESAERPSEGRGATERRPRSEGAEGARRASGGRGARERRPLSERPRRARSGLEAGVLRASKAGSSSTPAEALARRGSERSARSDRATRPKRARRAPGATERSGRSEGARRSERPKRAFHKLYYSKTKDPRTKSNYVVAPTSSMPTATR